MSWKQTLSMHYSYWNKILWLLTSAPLGWEMTFKCHSMRKQLLIPKFQHQLLSRTCSLSLSWENAPPPLSSSLERTKKKRNKNKRDETQSETTCSKQTNVLLKATVHNELYNTVYQHHVGPGLTVALGCWHLFLRVLMRHHEGMLRVKISRRLATYSTALGGITNTAAWLISYREWH